MVIYLTRRFISNYRTFGTMMSLTIVVLQITEEWIGNGGMLCVRTKVLCDPTGADPMCHSWCSPYVVFL